MFVELLLSLSLLSPPPAVAPGVDQTAAGFAALCSTLSDNMFLRATSLYSGLSAPFPAPLVSRLLAFLSDAGLLTSRLGHHEAARVILDKCGEEVSAQNTASPMTRQALNRQALHATLSSHPIVVSLFSAAAPRRGRRVARAGPV
jgi:hypothetical protein